MIKKLFKDIWWILKVIPRTILRLIGIIGRSNLGYSNNMVK